MAPLIAPPSGKSFAPASQGQQHAVLAEVRDLGVNKITTNFGGVEKTENAHQILFRWQLSELDPETKEPKRIYEKFRFSMHEKAKLYKRVSGMFGGRVPPKDYDFTKLEGLNYDLLIVHQTGKDGKVYTNIAGTVARAKDAAAQDPERSGSMTAWSMMSLPKTAILPWYSKTTPFIRI